MYLLLKNIARTIEEISKLYLTNNNLASEIMLKLEKNNKTQEIIDFKNEDEMTELVLGKIAGKDDEDNIILNLNILEGFFISALHDPNSHKKYLPQIAQVIVDVFPEKPSAFTQPVSDVVMANIAYNYTLAENYLLKRGLS